VSDSIRREFWIQGGPPSKGFGPVETSTVHDRMPAILNPDGYDLRLDPGMTNVAAASELFKPYRCSAEAVLSREHAGQPCSE
jgi:putative SOS response-associated peptidase YedK